MASWRTVPKKHLQLDPVAIDRLSVDLKIWSGLHENRWALFFPFVPFFIWKSMLLLLNWPPSSSTLIYLTAVDFAVLPPLFIVFRRLLAECSWCVHHVEQRADWLWKWSPSLPVVGLIVRVARWMWGAFRAELERDTAASQWVANYLSQGESQHSPSIRPDSSFCSFQSV